ncbi:MAG: hypothetical protein HKO65_00485 [Gemmatimonadetes bacterium]|nr:hypothetical protein [Gemmatimonadota bacterium]NNM03549.1 hypothetical protein [Gemmatimonadota bacterium]
MKRWAWAFLPLCLMAPPALSDPPEVGPSEAWEHDALFDPELLPVRRSEVDGGPPFDPGRAPFSLVVRDDPVPNDVFFVSTLPGELLDLQLEASDGRTTLRFGAGRVVASSAEGWIWEAPSEPGLAALRLEREEPHQAISLNVFILHPIDRVRSGVLNGYRIGDYAGRPLRGDSVYLPPPGFIEVSAEDEDILVSPHFTVGQFLCKQPGQPKYLALSRYLIAKLERVLERVNAAGYPSESLHIMSGFRTPWYNLSIGNRTVYSRHLWGGAADVFLDTDGDGFMDDLDGDGRSTIADARVLYELAEEVDRSSVPSTRPGGLGAYPRNSVRGPFVHVDARGRSARW